MNSMHVYCTVILLISRLNYYLPCYYHRWSIQYTVLETDILKLIN